MEHWFSPASLRSALPWLVSVTLSAAPEASAEEQRVLVEQKLRLVEMLVATQLAKSSASHPAPTGERLERGKTALSLARQALSENRLDDAGQILDQALRTATVDHAPPAGSLSADALRSAHANLSEQLATYRASFEQIAHQPKVGAAARALIIRLDGMSAEAGRAADLNEANRLLGEAYRFAIAELSRLRAGDEVIHSLKFASPAEEYAYELRRFESNRILIAMMIGEGKAAGETQAKVADIQTQARQLNTEAAQLAASEQYREALLRMEMATAQQNRALLLLGVPVF